MPMKITIHGRNFKPETQHYIQELFDQLTDRGIEIQTSEPFELFLQKSGIRKRKASFTVAEARFSMQISFSVLEEMAHYSNL